MKKTDNFTSCKAEPTLLSKNITDAMDKMGISAKSLADIAGISRQAVYDIKKGSIPRKDTLDLIAKALCTTPDELCYGTRYFDYDHFCKELNKVYNPNQHNGLDLQSYLIVELSVNPVDLFLRHILPPVQMQEEIAKLFNREPADVFHVIKGFSGVTKYSYANHANVISNEDFDYDHFDFIFKRLNTYNKKIVLNLCLDLLLTQPKKR